MQVFLKCTVHMPLLAFGAQRKHAAPQPSVYIPIGMGARAQVCLKGTLFTPLSAHNTSTQSLNVQLRKELDLHVNLVHGFNIPGVPSRFSDVDVVVIRCGLWSPHQGYSC